MNQPTTRTMYDSTTPAVIPADAEMVAGYVNGDYAWTPQDWERFEHAVQVHITVMAVNEAGVLDVESGDATPAQAPGWIKARLIAGLERPTIYCSRDTVTEVIQHCHAAGLVLGRDWWIWLATLDGTDHTGIPGVVAIQDKGAQILGFNADSSSVLDGTWHPSPLTLAQRLARVTALAEEILSVAGHAAG